MAVRNLNHLRAAVGSQKEDELIELLRDLGNNNTASDTITLKSGEEDGDIDVTQKSKIKTGKRGSFAGSSANLGGGNVNAGGTPMAFAEAAQNRSPYVGPTNEGRHPMAFAQVAQQNSPIVPFGQDLKGSTTDNNGFFSGSSFHGVPFYAQEPDNYGPITPQSAGPVGRDYGMGTVGGEVIPQETVQQGRGSFAGSYNPTGQVNTGGAPMDFAEAAQNADYSADSRFDGKRGFAGNGRVFLNDIPTSDDGDIIYPAEETGAPRRGSIAPIDRVVAPYQAPVTEGRHPMAFAEAAQNRVHTPPNMEGRHPMNFALAAQTSAINDNGRGGRPEDLVLDAINNNGRGGRPEDVALDAINNNGRGGRPVQSPEAYWANQDPNEFVDTPRPIPAGDGGKFGNTPPVYTGGTDVNSDAYKGSLDVARQIQELYKGTPMEAQINHMLDQVHGSFDDPEMQQELQAFLAAKQYGMSDEDAFDAAWGYDIEDQQHADELAQQQEIIDAKNSSVDAQWKLDSKSGRFYNELGQWKDGGLPSDSTTPIDSQGNQLDAPAGIIYNNQGGVDYTSKGYEEQDKKAGKLLADQLDNFESANAASDIANRYIKLFKGEVDGTSDEGFGFSHLGAPDVPETGFLSGLSSKVYLTDNQERFQADMNDLAIQVLTAKLGARPSDKDLEVLQSSLPSIKYDEATNLALMEKVLKENQIVAGNIQSKQEYQEIYRTLIGWHPGWDGTAQAYDIGGNSTGNAVTTSSGETFNREKYPKT